MDFDWSPAQRALRQTIIDTCAAHPAPGPDAEPAFPAALHRALGAAGVLGYGLPAPYGAGGGLLDLVLINETLAEHAPHAVSPCFVNQVCGALLTVGGNKAQKEELLPQLAAGSLTMAFALTEPQAGSDAAAIALQATPESGHYRLSGEKLYATGCWDADYIITAARTTAEGKASRGSSLIMVPREATGLTLSRLNKIGGRDHASCHLRYAQVQVEAGLRIGAENGAWPLLLVGAGVERICVAATCIGAVSAALRDVVAFLQQREQFGQPIADFQAIRHTLADLATRHEAMRWLCYRAAWLAQRSGPAAAGAVSMAKLQATEEAGAILLEIMKLHGGLAYLAEHPAPRRLIETMLAFYAGGTAQIQRELIARQVLAAR